MGEYEEGEVEERTHTVQMVPETVMRHAESEGMVTQCSPKDTT